MRTALLMAVAGAGLLVGADAFAADARAISIDMRQQTFVPATNDVTVGTRITWTNTDSMPHSVTANDGRFDSGAILPGKTFAWTASDPGTIAYHCIFHPSMTAVMTVHADAKKGGQ
jgi:plastocyanin